MIFRGGPVKKITLYLLEKQPWPSVLNTDISDVVTLVDHKDMHLNDIPKSLDLLA